MAGRFHLSRRDIALALVIAIVCGALGLVIALFTAEPDMDAIQPEVEKILKEQGSSRPADRP